MSGLLASLFLIASCLRVTAGDLTYAWGTPWGFCDSVCAPVPQVVVAPFTADMLNKKFHVYVASANEGVRKSCYNYRIVPDTVTTLRIHEGWKEYGMPLLTTYARVQNPGNGDFPVVGGKPNTDVARVFYADGVMVGTYICLDVAGQCQGTWRLSANSKLVAPSQVQKAVKEIEKLGVDTRDSFRLSQILC